MEVRLPDTNLEPWVVLTAWPVVDEPSVVRICCRYRQRWAVEDSFTCTKDYLGWEDVQVMDVEAVRTLVALAWVGAGFLYELGVTLAWAEVTLLARLGGWVPHRQETGQDRTEAGAAAAMGDGDDRSGLGSLYERA